MRSSWLIAAVASIGLVAAAPAEAAKTPHKSEGRRGSRRVGGTGRPGWSDRSARADGSRGRARPRRSGGCERE
jgi:hypothetical protein